MKTAVLVIHGIGEQSPFETLDAFVRGLGFEKAVHRLKPRPAGVDGGPWIESYIEVRDVDVFEYYWAYKAERQITLPEVIDWLVETGRGATRFYGKAWNYLADFNWLFRILPFPVLLGPAERLVVDFVGDVAIYTSTDIKSGHYAVRAAILAGAVERLRQLVDEYDRVFVVGHSLGSVIGYDAFNKLNLQMNVDATLRAKAPRVAGFITFGSPLDKIAFWFAERVDKDQVVRKQILEHLHSFRATSMIATPRVESTIERYLDAIPWVNFYDVKDPVSGRLDFYTCVENVELAMDARWGFAHTAYWKWRPMFDRVRALVQASNTSEQSITKPQRGQA